MSAFDPIAVIRRFVTKIGMRKPPTPYLALALAVAPLSSCESERAEQPLASEAGQLCAIQPERVCVFPGTEKMAEEMAEEYVISLYSEPGGEEKRANELSCLATFAKKKGFFLQSAIVARCRTEEELNILDAASAACSVPARELWVNIQKISIARSFTSINRTHPSESSEKGDACLEKWAKARGYGFFPYLRTD